MFKRRQKVAWPLVIEMRVVCSLGPTQTESKIEAKQAGRERASDGSKGSARKNTRAHVIEPEAQPLRVNEENAAFRGEVSAVRE